MKDKETQSLLKLSSSPSNKHLTNIQKRLYDLFILLLSTQSIPEEQLIAFFLIEISQLLSYTFDNRYSDIWMRTGNNRLFFDHLRNFFSYTRIAPLVQSNSILFLILYYVNLITLVIIFCSCIFLMSIKSQKRVRNKNLIDFTSRMLFAYKTILFIPILDLFISIFVINPLTFTLKYITIRELIEPLSGIHIAYMIFAVLGLLMFLVITFISVLLYYERRQKINNANRKSTNQGDLCIYLIKLITVVIFGIDEILLFDSSRWLIPFYLIFSSVLLLFYYILVHPFQDDFIMKVHICLLGIFTWGNCVLFFGRILLLSHFNGLFELFILGIPLILFIVFMININSLLTSQTKSNHLIRRILFENERESLRYITNFINEIDNQNDDRKTYCILTEFITIHNLYCPRDYCPLKKYSKIKDKENSTKETKHENEIVNMHLKRYHLFQYIDQLYHDAINKYPSSIIIRISYAIFLNEQMNQRDQSLQVLIKLEKYQLTFAERFIVYRLMKLNEQYALIKSSIEKPINNNNQSQAMIDLSYQDKYQYHYTKLHHYLLKVAYTYQSFWNLLLYRTQTIDQDIIKLRNYGFIINDKLKRAHFHLESIEIIKKNDLQTLTIYSNFLKYIINDAKESKCYYDMIANVEQIEITFEENEMEAIDISLLSKYSNFHYVVATKCGRMINISLELSGLLGYSHDELIGKECEVLIPEFMQSSHRSLIEKRTEILFDKNTTSNIDHKNTTVNGTGNNKNSSNKMKEIHSFAKTKSKYLILLQLKVCILKNENGELNLIAKIIPEVFPTPNTCLIITNHNLSIQSFTANAIKILGINNQIFNTSCDITNFIKEFCEEILVMFTDNPSIDKLMVKRKILKEKYINNMSLISWKKVPKNNIENFTMTTTYIKTSNTSNSFIQLNTEEHFILNVSEIIIDQEILGYSFKFNLQDIMSKSVNASKRLSECPGVATLRRGSINKSIISNSNTIKTEINVLGIDPNIIPEKYPVLFDPHNLSYVLKDGIRETVKEYCTREAKLKIDQVKEEKASYTSTSSYDEDNDRIDDDTSNKDSADYSSSCNSDSIKGQNTPSTKTIVSKFHLNDQQGMDSYYKVNMSKIIYSTFDFKKYMIIEINNCKKVSQVDIRKAEAENGRGTHIDNKTSFEKKSSFNAKSATLTSQPNDNKKLDTDINDSLSKLNNNLSYNRLRLYSFILLLGLSLTLLGSNIYYSGCIVVSKVLDQTLYSGYILLTTFAEIDFLSLEYIILHKPYYINFYQKKDDYIKEIQLKLLEKYNKTDFLINTLLASNLPLAPNRTEALKNHQLQMLVITEKFAYQPMNMSVISLLFDTMSSFHSFATEQNKTLINFNNMNYLFSVLNMPNGSYVGLNYIVGILQQEGGARVRAASQMNQVWLVVLFFLEFACFVVLMMVYKVIEKRQQWYLKIFFNISDGTIANLLSSCEHFITISQSTNSKNDADLNTSTSLSLIHHEKEEKKSKEKNGSNTNDDKGIFSKDDRHSNWINHNEKYWIIATLLIYFTLIYGIFGLYSNLYMSFLRRMGKAADIYYYTSDFEVYYLQMYNYLRNYAIGATLQSPSYHYYKNTGEDLLDRVYEQKSFFWETMTQFNQKGYMPNNSTSLFRDLINGNLCPYLDTALNTTLIASKLTCESFCDNITVHGSDMLTTYYNIQLRNLYRHTKDMFNSEPIDPLYPYIIFNSNDARDINIILKDIFIPVFETWINEVKISVSIEFWNFKMLTLLSLIAMEIMIWLLYFSYVIPKQSHLMKGLDKTKQMLYIIPKVYLYQILLKESSS